MSNLILPQKWTRQPQVPVEIDWSNPFGARVEYYFTPNFQGGRSRLSPSTPSGGVTRVSGKYGIGLKGNGSSGYVAGPPNISIAGQGALTRFAVLRVSSGGSTRAILSSGGSGGAMWRVANNTDLVWVKTNLNVEFTQAGILSAGEYCILVSVNNPVANAFYTYKNGVLVATTAAISTSAGGVASVGQSGTGSSFGDHELYLVGSLTGALSASEAREFTSNPWQIFKPQSRRIWVAGTSSGSTGTVAVTNANDTSSASGTTTVVGTAATTNANDTSVASGTTTILGTSATTNATDTSAASGTTTVVGTLATTNANDTVGASGSVGNSITGTVAYTNANDTLAASGTTTIVGTLARTNANDTSAANGTTTVIGTVSYTNANDTIAASGIVGTISGTVAYTNANDISTASGTAGSQASGSAPDYSVGKKKKFVVKVGDRLMVFSNQVDAINALPSEVKEPVKVKQYPAKKKSASANHSMANLQKPDSVPVAQPDETVPLQTVSEMAQAYNVQAQYDQLMRKMQYEALYSLYQDLLEEDDSEALLMVA